MPIALHHVGFDIALTGTPFGANPFATEHGPYADLLVNAVPKLNELRERVQSVNGSRTVVPAGLPRPATVDLPTFFWNQPAGCRPTKDAAGKPALVQDMLDTPGWKDSRWSPAEFGRISSMIYNQTKIATYDIYTGGFIEKTLASMSNEDEQRSAILKANAALDALLCRYRFRDMAGQLQANSNGEYAWLMLQRRGSREAAEIECTGSMWSGGNRPLPAVIMTASALRDPGRTKWVLDNRSRLPAFFVLIDDKAPANPDEQRRQWSEREAWHNGAMKATLVGTLEEFPVEFLKRLK